jgi:hypothetical protein
VVEAGTLGRVGDLLPQLQRPLEMPLGLGEGVARQGLEAGADGRGQGARLVPGGVPMDGDLRGGGRSRPAGQLGPGLQLPGERGVQAGPLAGQQLGVDRLWTSAWRKA